jgi:hypothetical protein
VAIAIVSIPFWFAPVLVFWGAQGPAQAMFSSVLALWRARAAFFLYFLGGMGVVMIVSMLAGFVLALFGPGVAGLLAIPLGLMLPAIFYVSLYFSFVTFALSRPSSRARSKSPAARISASVVLTAQAVMPTA